MVPMTMTLSSSPHPLWLFALGAVAIAVLGGLAFGKRHDPVAVEPDAKRPDGVEVATFALG